jgi:hypothetical protein
VGAGRVRSDPRMDWLLYDWPFASLAAAALMLLALFLAPRDATRPPRWRDPRWLIWLGVPMYMLHMFEEHGYDLLGRRYEFRTFMCTALGFGDALAACPADRAFIFTVNVVAVTGGGVLAGLLARRRPAVGACVYGIPLVNSLAHVVPALRAGAYNPGVLTAVLLFWPVTAWALRVFHKEGILDRRGLALVVASGVATHAVLLGGLQAVIHGVLGEAGLIAVQAANMLVPVAFGWAAGVPGAQAVLASARPAA